MLFAQLNWQKREDWIWLKEKSRNKFEVFQSR